ncbi:MAG: Rpn family recombination-promoting nuclease/putative transposase [Lachnospiraceae bacterium]|nr:Rpn family recombination-promoting nuclease/putative transposase [Lachnospiraceae bacterium]MDD3617534.1 Rpn family recombination-promoting nuclease/putative transposase [Lachnospiraceae bacterium]
MTLLKDLDLLDRFLFDEAMEDPETYAAVLKIIFQANVSLLSQSEVEKQLQTAPYLKSVRLDVFAMDEKGTLYNTEMQKNWKPDLQKRSRFYQSLIDSGLLPAGSVNYNLLKDSFIIMIMPFDLFGQGKYQYTFRPECAEVPGLILQDGTTRIFLNTRGTNDEEVSRELIDFLHYVENSNDETASQTNSELIKKIHERVHAIKSSEEMGVKYMQAWEEKIYEREEGREEGEELFAQLTKLLIQNSCEHDLLRATEDKAYRQLLYEEYGLLKGDA